MLTIVERATSAPDGIALVADAGATFTWRETADVVLRLAEAIRCFDLGPTRRVLVVARNRPATVVAHAAALLGEASAVPVNFHLTEGEIRYQAQAVPSAPAVELLATSPLIVAFSLVLSLVSGTICETSVHVVYCATVCAACVAV